MVLRRGGGRGTVTGRGRGSGVVVDLEEEGAGRGNVIARRGAGQPSVPPPPSSQPYRVPRPAGVGGVEDSEDPNIGDLYNDATADDESV